MAHTATAEAVVMVLLDTAAVGYTKAAVSMGALEAAIAHSVDLARIVWVL